MKHRHTAPMPPPTPSKKTRLTEDKQNKKSYWMENYKQQNFTSIFHDISWNKDKLNLDIFGSKARMKETNRLFEKKNASSVPLIYKRDIWETAVTSRFRAAEFRFQFQASPCGICGGHCDGLSIIPAMLHTNLSAQWFVSYARPLIRLLPGQKSVTSVLLRRIFHTFRHFVSGCWDEQ
jgi:hypothetical protein